MDNNLVSISAIGEVALEEPIYMTFGEATVGVRRNVSYVEILDMVQFVVNFAVTDQPIIDGALSQMLKDFAIVKFYTNLDVSLGKDIATIENIYDEYDILMSFGVIDEIKSKVSPRQLAFFDTTVEKTLEGVKRYQNSARGIMDSLATTAGEDSNVIQSAIDLLSGENAENIATIINTAKTISADKPVSEPIQKIEPNMPAPGEHAQ